VNLTTAAKQCKTMQTNAINHFYSKHVILDCTSTHTHTHNKLKW